MNVATFAEGNSVLHRIDPRLRVMGAVAVAAVVAVATHFATLGASLALALSLVVLARLPMGQVCRRLLGPLLFLLLLWLILPWSHPGQVLFQWSPLGISREGVVLCAQISIKTISLMLLFMALVATMGVDVLGHSLSRLHLPDKMVHLLLITYRYLFVLEQEYQRLVRAMKIRSFRPGTNLHSYRSYAYLVGMLFVRASERARRVHCAMICRGFSGRFHSLRRFNPHPFNPVFSVAVLLAMALLIGLEWAP